MPNSPRSGARQFRNMRRPSWNRTGSFSILARPPWLSVAAMTWYGIDVTYGQSWLNSFSSDSCGMLTTLGIQR